MKCPKCKKNTVRVGVSLFLDIPYQFYACLSKNLRDAKTKLAGAGWDRAYFYCARACGFATHLSGEHEANRLSAMHTFLQSKGLADEALEYVRNSRVPKLK